MTFVNLLQTHEKNVKKYARNILGYISHSVSVQKTCNDLYFKTRLIYFGNEMISLVYYPPSSHCADQECSPEWNQRVTNLNSIHVCYYSQQCMFNLGVCLELHFSFQPSLPANYSLLKHFEGQISIHLLKDEWCLHYTYSPGNLTFYCSYYNKMYSWTCI